VLKAHDEEILRMAAIEKGEIIEEDDDLDESHDETDDEQLEA